MEVTDFNSQMVIPLGEPLDWGRGSPHGIPWSTLDRHCRSIASCGDLLRILCDVPSGAVPSSSEFWIAGQKLG